MIAILLALLLAPAPKPNLAAATAVYFSGPVADLALTEYGLSKGMQEGNPLARNRAVRVSARLGVAGAFMAYDLHKRKQGKGTTKLRVVWFLGNAAVVGWNIHAIRQNCKRLATC